MTEKNIPHHQGETKQQQQLSALPVVRVRSKYGNEALDDSCLKTLKFRALGKLLLRSESKNVGNFHIFGIHA